MNNVQIAELTDIINKMKQGNPPATEGEIARVVEEYSTKSEGEGEPINGGSGIEIGSYDDDLDMSNAKTIIDKSEGEVVDAYLDSPDHPGLAVEKAGFMFGDAVNFVRPDGSRIYVDLQNDLENEQKKLDELNAWYGENEEKASLGLWGTLGAAAPTATGADVNNRFVKEKEVENVNTSLSKMHSEGGNNYRVEHARVGEKERRAQEGKGMYTLTSDSGDDIEFEEWGDLQKYLWDNVTEEELSMLREADLDEADVVIREGKEVEAKRYSDLTDEEAMDNWVEDGRARNLLESRLKDLNLNTDDQALFDSMLSSDDAIDKAISGVSYGNNLSARFKNLYNSLGGEYDIRTVGNDPRRYSDEGREKVRLFLENLNPTSSMIEAEKRRMADDFGSKWVQTKLKNHPNYRGIQAALDAETSSTNVKPQFQAHKDKFKNLEDLAKTDIKKVDARTNDILSNISSLRSKGSDIGYTTKEINGKHIITITGGDKELVKQYQNQVNKQQGIYNNIIGEYEKEHGNLVDKYDTWRAETEEYTKAAGISNREMDTFTLMGEDLLGGFEQMALGMPAAFGSEAAMDGLDALQAESESLAMDLGYDEAWELGETGSYVGRSISKQTANVAVAVAASSLGMPPVAVEATVGTIFGLGAGGQKRQQLRTASRMAEQAKLDMVDLEKLKDSMDPEEYAEQMAQLKKIEAVGDLDRWQIESIVWGTAAIEGVVTAKLGTLPNARAMKNVFGGKGVNVNPYMTKGQRMKDFLWKFGKGVGGEIAEEEIILFGSETWEGVMNREHDISFAEWDETLVQAVLLAGPMNGPTGAYSSVTQHMAGKEYRELFDDVTEVNTRLSRELKDPNLTEDEKERVQTEWVENLARLGVEGSGLEVDAMVTGPDGLRKLAATALSLNRLYIAADVKHTDSPADKQKKIDDHIAELEKKSKTEAQSFKDRYDRAVREKAKIHAATKAKYKENTALDEGGIIEQIYGSEGLKMALEMAEKDSKFKKLPDRDKLITIHEKIKKDFLDSEVAAAKRDDKVIKMVESMVYDEVDNDGNKLKGGKEGYFKRNNKKRRTSKQIKEEERLYELWATQQNSRIVEGITLNKDVTLKKPPSLTEADIKSFDDILDDKGEVVETAQQQLENFINKQDIPDSEKKYIIDGFRKGEVNGTIIDGKYIVLDAVQARKNLAEGTLLQATAILHEYSHFLDNITMKDGEMVQMAENLNESLESNPILKLLHDAIVERGSNIFDSDGNPEYNSELPFKEQSNKAKEEYVKYAEEMLLQRAFWRQLNEAKKAGAGIGNTLRGFVGGDFNFKSEGTALHYIVAYGQSWLKGEDSKLVERKKKAFVPRKDDEKGTTSESRSARDGFAERTIAIDLGLKDSTRKIVEKNEEIYQRIVDIAEAKGVRVSKALVTQSMRDELVENNLARAFALARRAAGVARNLTLEEGLKIDNVTEWFQEYSLKLAELARTWDPSKNDSFGAYMNQLLPKKYSGILEGLKSELETKSMDSDEATRRRVEAIEVESDTESRPDTRRKKTNVLKIGNVEGKADVIKDAVEVNPGDTFKEVSDLTNINGNTAKVGEIIFDVPGKKILDRNEKGKSISANLTYAKKIVNGIPEASEAGNIQSFYNQPQTIDKLLKILPPENVSSSDADINEIGENIDVDRDILGRGLGLNNNVLNYFYDKTNKRSQGLKSQPFIWKLKPEFKNPTTKTVAKVQADLGITPRGELNNYNRDIGQLLKGVAKFQAQQTALSTAQRILTERKASKKQIASVTAAQSKTAFSENISEIGKFMRQNLAMDDARVRDKLLIANKLAPTFKITKSEDIEGYTDMLKRDVFPLLPYEAWFGPRGGTILTTSAAFNLSSKDPLWAEIQAAVKALDKGPNDKSIKYGAPIDGVNVSEMWSLRNKYKPLFETPEKARENIKNGEIADFNEQVGLIHEALWKRISKSIKKNKNSASGIATYLGLTANDTGHWHKMGAQFAGFSTELTKRKKDKKGRDQKIRVEYEHAMPATQAYLYLLNAAINHNESFDYTYGKIIENYKLIALDKAMDDKLRYARTKRGRSLMTNMPDGWNPETGFWWERYFNDIAYAQDGGIDPSSIEGLDGKTFAEKLNINAAGVDPALEFVREADEKSKDSKILNKSLKASSKASRSGTNKNIVKVGKWNLDISTKQGKKIAAELADIKTVSSSEFKRVGRWSLDTSTKEGKRILAQLEEIPTVSSSETKGITVLDFDDTLATTKSNVLYTMPDGTTGKLNAEEFARQGGDLLAQGAIFDFSEFDKVVGGKTAPLFNKAMKLSEKFGTDNMFILTARSPNSAQAIKQFLDTQGLNIPLKNITGLGKSEAEAKALWIAEKVGEGYNDFYFADDAIQNVKAVKDMLNTFDVKGKVQQAKTELLDDPETSINDIKDTKRLANPGTYSNIRFSRSHRSEYENTISKNRPDLVRDGLVSKTIDNMFDFIDGLNVPGDKKRKYERITTKWLATSNVKLAEDQFKITDAINLAERFKLDLFSYNNPNEIIEAYAGKVKKKPLDPNKVKEFSEGVTTNEKHGITEHVVEDTKEGQQAVRDIIDSHWGKKSNPWCVTQTSDSDIGYAEINTLEDAKSFAKEKRSEGATVTIKKLKEPGREGYYYQVNYENKTKGKLTEESWEQWVNYGDKPKSIVFQNGKLLALKANNLYWDRMDNDTKFVVVNIKEGRTTTKVELRKKPRAVEKVTVSQDGNTTTTEYLVDTNENAKGTKIVEERRNGKRTKTTELDFYGNVKEVKTFGPDGSVTEVKKYDAIGKLWAVNMGIVPGGYPPLVSFLKEKGDIAIRERYDNGVYTLEATVLIEGEARKIQWEAPDNESDLKNVTNEVNGKTRVDLKKVLELDPKAKGVPGSGVQFSRSGSNTMSEIIDEGAADLDSDLNIILEETKDVDRRKRFSAAKARKRGKNKGRFKFFIPPSADDFAGLMYAFMGKGKQGERHHEFFKKNLFDPFSKGIRQLNRIRQSVANDLKQLKKTMPDVRKKLGKKIAGTEYTYEDAIRVYNWDKAGFDIPGLSNTDKKALIEAVENDAQLKTFAQGVNSINNVPGETVEPGNDWLGGTINSDISEILEKARATNLQQWIDNKNIIFNEANLNKIEAVYGAKFREALEDSLWRMEHGGTRSRGKDRLLNNWMTWVHGSVGATMFFNARSAILQQLSNVNFLNWHDNNPIKAAKAFANQKQYWTDFAMIFNSPWLKQRRSGITTDVNATELLNAMKDSKNPMKTAIAYLLRLGFTPTQIGDSLAIATGGSTMYRNRVNTYIDQGMSKTDAEAKAWIDMMEVAEETQQSTREDKISQQQASPLGKFILAFQNVTMQYNRIMKKATLDLVNGRGDPKANISKIIYYGTVQNMIFYGLQQALFAAMFSDDDDDQLTEDKKVKLANGMLDSVLRGSGIHGAVIATVKNVIMKFMKEKEKMDDNKFFTDPDWANVLVEGLNVSPPIGIKARKIHSALKTWEYNDDIIRHMDKIDIDNPMWEGMFNVTEAVTNAPLHRVYNKTMNIRESLDTDNETWKRVAMFMGWSRWSFGIRNQDVIDARGEVKVIKAKEKKDEASKAFIKDQEKERDKGQKNIKCAAATRSGNRCGKKVLSGGNYCTIHVSVPTRKDGKKTQCTHIKGDGKRCKMKTTNKSGKCYYHD